VRRVLPLVIALWSAGCGLEGELFGPAMDRGHVILPEPSATLVVGQATALSHGAVRLYTSGVLGPDVTAAIEDDGAFTYILPGTFGAVGAVLWAATADAVAFAVVPEIAPAETIFHEPRVVYLWDQHSVLGEFNSTTTLASMVLFTAARRLELGLDALGAETIRTAYDDVLVGLDVPDSPLWRLGRAVATLHEATSAAAAPRYRVEALDGLGSFLSAEWLAGAEVDYDGDGFIDSDVEAFDALLVDAASELSLDVCFDDDLVRVIFHVDLRSGRQDGNCAEVDPFKHTKDSPSKAVFFTGGVHEDTPVCTASRTTHCMAEAEIDAANVTLGDWVPNLVPMRDDGMHGDAQANDGVWTLAVTLPHIAVDTSPDGAGVRLGYKYTFGQAGGGWSDSEEWPGNRRLLELVDLTGDHLVTRYDIFGDETANKDFVNSLSPAQGGCGVITWEADRPEACAGGTRENLVDLDGDCEVDAWDQPGPIAPLTVPCPAL
jgi:hypothetical protein